MGALERLRDAVSVISEWWVDRTLEEAIKGAALDGIARMLETAVSAGAQRSHPKLIRALVEGAKTVKARFSKFDISDGASLPAPPPIGQANMAADAIERVIRIAADQLERGSAGLLEEANTIIKDLRNMESQWKRLAAREQRLAKAKADAST